MDHVAAATEILIMIQEETILLCHFRKQKPELRCGVTRSSCCEIKRSKKRLLWPRKRDNAYFFIRFYFNLFNLILSRVAGSHIYDRNSVISIYNYIVKLKNILYRIFKKVHVYSLESPLSYLNNH